MTSFAYVFTEGAYDNIAVALGHPAGVKVAPGHARRIVEEVSAKPGAYRRSAAGYDPALPVHVRPPFAGRPHR